MKLATANDYDRRARRIDRDVACPQCSARAMVFADGAVLCLAEGGISFVPEATDGELFQLRQAYLARTVANPATVADIAADTAGDTQILWLPKRACGSSWERIEEKLGIRRTGKEDQNSQCTWEVIVPAGWKIVESKVSFFQRYLVDSDGKPRAELFYKDYRADFAQLIELNR
jgi:hypothetical protein